MSWKWKSPASARCATASWTRNSSSPLPSALRTPSPTRGEGNALVLLLDLGYGAVDVFALRAILAERAQQRRIRRRVEHRIAPSGVDVTAPEEVRQRHDVVLFPIEALLADLGESLSFHHHHESRGGLALHQQFFAGAQKLGTIIE